MNQAADECGWRRLADPGTIRVSGVDEPDYYETADIYEQMLNALYDPIPEFPFKAVARNSEIR
jgi:hypothetical protein